MDKKLAEKAMAKHGSQRAAAAALGVSRSAIQRALGLKQNGHVKHCMRADPDSRKTIADFQRQYDKDYIIPQKLKAAIKELGAGGWDYEVAFAKSAGVSLSDLAAYREMFDEYIVCLKRDNKRAWAGSIATAQKMREML